MRVAMLVQQIDEADWLRAFIIRWVEALARHVAHLDVITLEYHPTALPENVQVHSLGKEDGKSRAREFVRLQRALWEITPRADVLFAHMTPIFTVLAAPQAQMRRTRQVLWFTHRHRSRMLDAATACAWRVTTAAPDSFPIATPKLRVLGHGIDTGFFAPGDPPAEPNLAVQVARLMPIKHQATLIHAAAQIPDLRLTFVGAAWAGDSYARYLRARVETLNLADRVTFAGGETQTGVRGWLRKAWVAVNLSPPGLFDKAALESMAAGVPTIVSSAAFDPLLGDAVPLLRVASPDDVDGLVGRLRDLLAMSPDDRAALAAPIRARVAEAHSLDHLMARLVRVFETGER